MIAEVKLDNGQRGSSCRTAIFLERLAILLGSKRTTSSRRRWKWSVHPPRWHIFHEVSERWKQRGFEGFLAALQSHCKQYFSTSCFILGRIMTFLFYLVFSPPQLTSSGDILKMLEYLLSARRYYDLKMQIFAIIFTEETVFPEKLQAYPRVSKWSSLFQNHGRPDSRLFLA